MSEQILGDYFRSLKGPFERTLVELEQTHSLLGISLGVAVFFLVFSITPLVPYLLVHLVPVVAHAAFLSVRGHLLPLNSFLVWWLLAAYVSGLSVWVLAKASARSAKAREKRSLSTPQMRFALCYGLCDEIRNYQINHLSEHIDKALDYCDRLASLLYRMLGHPLTEQTPARFTPNVRTIEAEQALDTRDLFLLTSPLTLHWSLKDRFDWFRVEPKTESILQSIASFHPKIHDRIKDRKDLAIVEKALLDLAAYLYSIIPEIPPTSAKSNVRPTHNFGTDDLERFATSINALPQYASEAKVETKEGLFAKLLLAGFRACGNLFSHQNMLICFFSWYVVSLILVLGGFGVAHAEIAGLKADSVIVSTIIGTPLVAAFTAVVAISQRRRGHDAS